MNNDLISRKALKDFINKVCFSEEWIKYRVDYGSKGQIDCILAYIDNAPTAIAVDFGADGGDKTIYSRPTGEWIECEEWNEIYYECSVCKEPWCTLDGTPVDNLMNYCPVCGAKMQGVRKKEE